MATWRRCEKCRRVLSDDDFEANATMCRACATKPARVARAGAVSTRRVVAAAPRPTAAGSADSMESHDRPKREGVVGRGDPEVRGRRARTQALQELAAMHADDYDRLLQEARRAEGLT